MDLLSVYNGQSPSTTPSNSPPNSPNRRSPTDAVVRSTSSHEQSQQITKLVTGTAETIEFDEHQFSQLERRLTTSGSTIDPKTGAVFRPHQSSNCNRKRPPSPRKPSVPGSSKDNDDKKNQSPKRPRSEKAKAKKPFIPSSELHISESQDYQLRSWSHPPSTARSFADLETYTPYIPKTVKNDIKAHDRGVSSVQFSQPYGHLMLSTGLDGIARIWSSESDTNECLRSYTGHTQGIRDAVFNQDSSTFLSAGYDRCVRLWDTESGRIIGSYSTDAIPYCVRFSPLHDGKEFVVACGDKKVIQIDTRDASNIVQQYDEHMGAVNSICFVDDDRRFVSSSDDKVLRLWEYGVPVVIRHLSDPTAHSMPVTMLHPNRKSLACQSMDNTVRIFTMQGKFKSNNRKSFNGHLVAGYACGLKTSPDGRFLASADSLGRIFFWDWKTSRVFRSLQGHKGVCIGVDWHPTQPSLVASAGWDGRLKLWT